MRTFIFGLLCGIIVGPAIALLIVLSGFAPVPATAEPPAVETAIAVRALNASVQREAPMVQNPMPASSENLRAGMKVYRDGCSGCHGDASKPSEWGTTSFYPRVPQFGQQPPNRPDWQLFWIVKKGIRYSGMGASEGQMSDDKMWQVVTFLSHLKTLPPDIQSEWVKPN